MPSLPEMKAEVKEFYDALDRKLMPPRHPAMLRATGLLIMGSGQCWDLLDLANDLDQDKKVLRHDLYRSALITAGSCMDATMKELIRATLPLLAEGDRRVRKNMAKKIARILPDNFARARTELVELALWPEQAGKEDFIERAIDKLTSHSLQSVDQLEKIRGVFELSFEFPDQLGEALKARNEIVHEMDIKPDVSDFRDVLGKTGVSAAEKNEDARRDRSGAQSILWCTSLFQLTCRFLCEVNAELPEEPVAPENNEVS